MPLMSVCVSLICSYLSMSLFILIFLAIDPVFGLTLIILSHLNLLILLSFVHPTLFPFILSISYGSSHVSYSVHLECLIQLILSFCLSSSQTSCSPVCLLFQSILNVSFSSSQAFPSVHLERLIQFILSCCSSSS